MKPDHTRQDETRPNWVQIAPNSSEWVKMIPVVKTDPNQDWPRLPWSCFLGGSVWVFFSWNVLVGFKWFFVVLVGS